MDIESWVPPFPAVPGAWNGVFVKLDILYRYAVWEGVAAGGCVDRVLDLKI